MTTAAPPRPIDTIAATDAEFEALIREARRRALKRRLFVAVAVAVGFVSVIGLVLNPGGSTGTPTDSIRVPVAAEGAAAQPVTAGSAELVASVYRHQMYSDVGALWVYLYDDGRVVRSGDRFALEWEVRQLSAHGVDLVLQAILSTGIVEVAVESDSPDDTARGGSLQLRMDGELRYIAYQWARWADPATLVTSATTPGFAEAADLLSDLEFWLPAEAWSSAEGVRYRPARYAVCTSAGVNGEGGPIDGAELRSVLPASAVGLLRSSPTLDRATFDPAAMDYGPGWDWPDVWGGCRHVSATEASTLLVSLAAAGWIGQGNLARAHAYLAGPAAGMASDDGPLWGRLEFTPVLPHGVPGTTPG